MDRRADIAPPSAPSFAARQISSGDSSLTSSSSSSSSGSDILRQVHAAVVKRHRRLGEMKGSFSRARRVLVSQAEQSKSGNHVSSLPSGNAWKTLIPESSAGEAERILRSDFGRYKDAVALSVMNPTEDSLFSSSSMSGTITNMCGGNVAAIGTQKRTEELNVHEKKPPAFDDVPKDKHSSLIREGPMSEVTSLGYLGPEEHDVGQMEMCKNTNGAVATVSERNNETRKKQQLLVPLARTSLVASFLGTSMSAHSGPTVQSNIAPLAGQATMQTQVSSSAVENFSTIPDHASLEGRCTSPKGNDVLQDDVTKRKEDVASDAKDCNKDIQPSQLSKAEKASRKKKYDPNVFFRVNGKLYQKLGKIGSGGSSEVHKVISSDCTIYALKMIKLKGRDYPTAYGFCQEIEYLNKLKGKNHIIQLIDYEVTDKTLLKQIANGSMAMKDGRINEDEFIYMVLEYGEIDLAHMLAHKWRVMHDSSSELDENWLRFYWQQMLEAVHTIHEERIVHSDLKPANFLLVRGSLKLIDFGIAKAILSDTTNIQRDAQVGTLNYMSPEAFMWNEEDANGSTIKCGRPSDIWSLGCILHQMVYGKTPFAEYKTFWAKFKAITDKRHVIAYEPVSNPWLIDLLRRCLAWDRDERWRIPQLLRHPFLTPPLPPPELGRGRQYAASLVRGMEAFWGCPEVARLCSELHELVRRLELERAQWRTHT